MTDKKVFLIQSPSNSNDFSSAVRYGTIMPVLSNGDMPSILPGPCLKKVRESLEDMQETDYLLWAGGDPFALILAGIVVAEKGFKNLKYLRWEKEKLLDGSRSKNGFYIPIEMTISAIRNKIKDHEEYVD